MALMKCLKCGHSVSDTADNCPKCNFDNRAYLAEQSKLKSEKAAEEYRKNAKCPECSQKLTWKYRWNNLWDAPFKVYGAYCTHCGYKDEQYRDFSKKPYSYSSSEFDPPESETKPAEPAKPTPTVSNARRRSELWRERNIKIMQVRVCVSRPTTREDLEEVERKIAKMQEEWTREDLAAGLVTPEELAREKAEREEAWKAEQEARKAEQEARKREKAEQEAREAQEKAEREAREAQEKAEREAREAQERAEHPEREILERERQAKEWAAQLERKAQEKARADERQQWLTQGLCYYCGGELGGLLTKKCKSCGKVKNY